MEREGRLVRRHLTTVTEGLQNGPTNHYDLTKACKSTPSSGFRQKLTGWKADLPIGV